jgi:hypothetical protein
MKAELLIRERVVYPDGAIVEMVAWRVPQPVPPSSHGLKYRLAYIADGKRILGYDNERGKGDHRHAAGREMPFTFTSMDDLLSLFVAEVEALRQGREP